MALLLDYFNKTISVTSPTVEVDAQVLHDFIEDEMSSPIGLLNDGANTSFFGDILKPEGKIEDETNPGVFSQIILVLNPEWQIQFWQGSGYTRIFGGKIVGGVVGQPMKATGSAGDITVLESPVDGLVVATGSGLTTEQDTKLTEVHGETQFIERWIHVDTEQLTDGIGTQKTPFNLLDSALTYMEANNLTRLSTVSDLTLDRQLKNFIVGGIGNPTIDFNGQNLNGSEFYGCTLKGLMGGVITIADCELFHGVQVAGIVRGSAFLGTVDQIGDTTYPNCHSGVTGLGYPKLKITSGNAGVRGFIGSLGVESVTAGDHSIGIGSDGRFIAEAACIGGVVHVRGFPFQIVDNSAVGCSVLDETDSSKVTALPSKTDNAKAVWDYTKASAIIAGSMGEHVGKKLLTFIKFLGSK